MLASSLPIRWLSFGKQMANVGPMMHAYYSFCAA